MEEKISLPKSKSTGMIICILILSIIFALIPAYAIEFTVLDADHYTYMMNRTEMIPAVRESLTEKIIEDIREKLRGKLLFLIFSDRIESSLRSLIDTTLTDDWLYSEISDTASSWIGYIKGDVYGPKDYIDLSEPKEALSERIAGDITDSLKKLPEITGLKEIEIADLALAVLEFMGIPDHYPMEDIEQERSILSFMRNNILKIRLTRIIYLFILPVFLLFLLLLLTYFYGTARALRSIGWCLILASFIAGVSLIFMQIYFKNLGYPGEIFDAISITIRRGAISPMLFLAGGILFLTAGYAVDFLKERHLST